MSPRAWLVLASLAFTFGLMSGWSLRIIIIG